MENNGKYLGKGAGMQADNQSQKNSRILPIEKIAVRAGISLEDIQPYGKFMAKVDPRKYTRSSPPGKLILVTAMTPTPSGEGKTTISIGLADGLAYCGQKAMLALREPSLGPVFGMKGGATGGGKAQVMPMENINLHFTGDLHAVTSANNLLAAMVDNHIQQGNVLDIDPRQIIIRRCMDISDRQLRHITSGLGGKADGMPREDGFDITAASEVMAILCMASDLDDLKERLSRMYVARTYRDKPVFCRDIGAQGAMTALLRDAMMPNLVQTGEGVPCLIHGGPFANIAHGCNSVAATKLAGSLADYVVTEAGFGADLGAEKFLDIKCRRNGLWPHCAVVVATIRALKYHGGAALADAGMEDIPAVRKGAANLLRHVSNLHTIWKLPVVVALNRFDGDTTAEINSLSDILDGQGIPFEVCDAFTEGGRGAEALARRVMALAGSKTDREPFFAYREEDALADKIRAIATRVYGADDVLFDAGVLNQLERLSAEGYSGFPVCIAKTQSSFSDDKLLRGAPSGFTIHLRNVKASAGAGFIVAFAGDIIAMPGLPKAPAALNISVDKDGNITGLY
jgi:formate--tetrahydrofolate ligase